MSQPAGFGTEVDEDELNAELDELAAQEIDVQLMKVDATHLPSAEATTTTATTTATATPVIPAAPKTVVKPTATTTTTTATAASSSSGGGGKTKTDDELAKLEASMA